LREVLSSWVQLKDLVRLQESANNKLKQKLSEVAIAFEDNYDVEFELITTALCNKMIYDEPAKQITLKWLSIVNGCQSLNTILSCSEKIKTLDDAFIMLRFYEIPQRYRSDRISISTNSQSSIKPRDLRSNDKRVLNLKRSFEQKYPQGYLKTKRGETLPANKDKNYELD
jgi:hypothetical protein